MTRLSILCALCRSVVSIALSLAVLPGTAWAAIPDGPAVAGIPVDFVLFALTLVGVAVFHHHTLRVAVTGLAVITVYKVLFAPFREGAGLTGLIAHLGHEWVLLANLLGLL